MAHWGTTSESGILRKNKPKDNHDDLLVFGYACKLFRDDDKALYVDKGKHLIPWMGDEKLKIDRYDCRGALSDISPYEASREGFDAMRWLGLNESERKLEQLCDKERYYSLHINEEEEQMYKEEEEKRQKTNEFQYSYDVPTDPAQEMVATVPEAEEEDEEYSAPLSLDVPVDIALPKTVKESARIEKTALFVCKQGPQMEILIKAKQSDNPQFGFLNQGHNLYKFYRHVLSAIKSGRYQIVSTNQTEEKREENSDNGSENDHYLHPSLVSASHPVLRIQGNQLEVQAEPPKTSEAYAQMTYEQQQYYQYYYAAQYYEYYKQLAQYQQGNGQTGQTVQPPDTQLDPSIQNYIQQMAYAQYMQQQSSNTNPYAQIVSSVNKDVANPYSALLANLQHHLPERTGASSAIKEPKVVTATTEVTKIVTQDAKPKPEKPLLSLAQYGSDSEDDDDNEEEEIVKEELKIPTGETKVVIDKMASYVAKNGEQFEEIVKAKGDPRFEFLETGHEFHKYYRNKIKEGKSCQETNEKREVKIVPASPPKPKEKKIIAPVCFSIKKPKDDGPKEIKSALPVEESDDDDDVTTEQPVVPIENNKEIELLNETSNESSQRNGIFDTDDPILEMIDLTDDIEERKDAKRAEDKIKDKLAAAAREKMASVARDRALQLERKRKAAAFLKLKSAETVLPDRSRKRSRSKERKNNKDIVNIEDSGDEDDRKRKSSKRKKSHKRKHSKSKHESRSKKKSKKKRRRSGSVSSTNSKSS